MTPAFSTEPRYEAESLLGLPDAELAKLDPIASNLLVARGVPALRNLDVERYVRTADDWAGQCARWMAGMEGHFHEAPHDWRNDLALFRLGLLYQFMDQALDVKYKEDQRDLAKVSYTDPADLFANGVMDTRRGTCGNMAALYMGLAWRFGWPVSLATAWSHLLVRYDDGTTRHNVESSGFGQGGFSAPPDRWYVEKYAIPEVAVECGSDLRALTPREVLGQFFGLRARYFMDTGRYAPAERDYLLARSLNPTNRWLYCAGLKASLAWADVRFDPDEPNHPAAIVRSLFGVPGQPIPQVYSMTVPHNPIRWG